MYQIREERNLEGRPPQRAPRGWYVWCVRGALEVLQKAEYVDRLCWQPNYCVLFANGSSANISPKDPLWEIMAKIAQNYSVEVYPKPGNGWVPWTGDNTSLQGFDCINITLKPKE